MTRSASKWFTMSTVENAPAVLTVPVLPVITPSGVVLPPTDCVSLVVSVMMSAGSAVLVITSTTSGASAETVAPSPRSLTVTPRVAFSIKPVSRINSSGSGADSSARSPFQVIWRRASRSPSNLPLPPSEPSCHAKRRLVREYFVTFWLAVTSTLPPETSAPSSATTRDQLS